MDVDPPPRFGALGDPNPPPLSPGSANPNPPEPAAPIVLPTLSPKQSGKDPSIIPSINANIVKININVMAKKNSTSSMLQHVKVRKKCHFLHDDKQKTSSFQTKREGESNSNVLLVANYREKKIRLALPRMIVIDELPFKFVKQQDFQEFIQIVKPRFPNPHCTTIANACMTIYYNEMDVIRRAFVRQ